MKPHRLFKAVILLWSLAVLTVAFLPGALSKYVATGNGIAAARFASFSAPSVVNNNIGHRVMYYFHKGNNNEGTASWIPNFFIRFYNTSEVAARYKVEFYNVLDSHGRSLDSSGNPVPRTKLFPATYDFYTWQTGSDSYPRFRIYSDASSPSASWTYREPSYPASWYSGADGVRAADYKDYYDTNGDLQGVLLYPKMPGNDLQQFNPGSSYWFAGSWLDDYQTKEGYDGITLRWEFTGQRSNAAKYDNDTTGDFSKDKAYRINYDLVAAQVD